MTDGESSSEQENRSRTERALQNHGIAITYIGIVVLIILDFIPQASIDISWQIIALISILTVTPFIGNLKRIWVSNVGGVELETEISETRASLDELLSDIPDIPETAKSSVEQSKDRSDKDGSDESSSEDETSGQSDEQLKIDQEGYLDDLGGEPSSISDELYRLLENDPRLALAKLRMEMEEAVDSLLITMGYEKPQTSAERYNILDQRDEISREVIENYSRVKNLCNKAIHGEEVQMEDAIEIVDLGTDLISGIRSRELYERFKQGEDLRSEELETLAEHSESGGRD